MAEKTVTMQIAEYSVQNHWDSFTEKDIRMAKIAFIDWFDRKKRKAAYEYG